MTCKDSLKIKKVKHYFNFLFWLSAWQQILGNWDYSYFYIPEIANYIKNTGYIKNIEYNSLSKCEFSHSGKYAWPSSVDNAKLVIKEAKYYGNLFDLLLNHPFTEILCIHKTFKSLISVNQDYDEETYLEESISNSPFANSKQSQLDYFNSLKISNWSYNQVIISAIYYCLENIFIENKKLPKTIFWEKAKFSKKNQQKSLLFDVFCFLGIIFDYLLYFETSEDLVTVFHKTKIISTFRLEFIKILSKVFKEIDENKLLFRDFKRNKNINRFALLSILKKLNLNLICSNEVIVTLVEITITQNRFLEIRSLLKVFESFLEKLNEFKGNLGFNSFCKQADNNSLIIKRSFIIAFFQIETLNNSKITYEYDFGSKRDLQTIVVFDKICNFKTIYTLQAIIHNFQKINNLKQNYQNNALQTQQFITFFHLMFSSISMEFLYSTIQTQYFFLETQHKQIKNKKEPKKIFKKIQKNVTSLISVSILLLVIFLTIQKRSHAAGFSPTQIAASRPLNETTELETLTSRGVWFTSRHRQLALRAQASASDAYPSGSVFDLNDPNRTRNRRRQVMRDFRNNPFPIEVPSPPTRDQAWFVELHRGYRILVVATGQSEFYATNTNSYEQFIIVHGAGGSYGPVRRSLQEIKRMARRAGVEIVDINDLVLAHIAPARMRNNSNIDRDKAAVIFASKIWNQVEESGIIRSRDLSYRDGYRGVPFYEIVANSLDLGREEIIAKVIEKLNQSRISNIPPSQIQSRTGNERILNQLTIEGHKEMTFVAAREIAQYPTDLQIAPEEGLFAFYIRDIISKMEDIYVTPNSPIQTIMFNSQGNGRRQVYPAIVLKESLEDLDLHYKVGRGYCELITELGARAELERQLDNAHDNGYVTAERGVNSFVEKTRLQSQTPLVRNLPFFESAENTNDIFPHRPDTQAFKEYLTQRREGVQNEPPLNRDQAMFENKRQNLKIGDINRTSKHSTNCISDRTAEQIFTNEYTTLIDLPVSPVLDMHGRPINYGSEHPPIPIEDYLL